MTIDKKINDKLGEKINQIMGSDEHIYFKNKFIDKICLFVTSWYYILTTNLYFNIKYFIQRHTRGFDDLDKWNAAWYIARKSIPVLTAMRKEFHGTSIKWHREDRFGNIIELTKDEVFVDDDIPAAFTEEEWKNILDDIIFAFKFVLDEDDCGEELFNEQNYKERYKRHKRGLKLLSIYFVNLWD